MFDTAYEIAFLIIGLFGSLTTILAFLPQCIKTIHTRNTSGLSLWFFIIAIVSSFFWLTMGIMSICSPYYFGFDKSSIPSALSSGIPPIITNVITLCLNTIVLVIKIRNMRKAKSLNISEIDYCQQKMAKKQSKTA